LIGACSTVVDITVKDQVSFSNFETSFPTEENGHRRIRLRGASVSGDYTQSLTQGHILIDDISIGSPAYFTGSADVRYRSLAYGQDMISVDFVPDQVNGFFYLGIGQTDLDFTLRNGVDSYRVKDTVTELYAQSGLYLALDDSLYAEVSYAISLSQEISIMSEMDLKLNYQLSRQLRLSGGYRFYNYTYEENPTNSDILINFRGLVFGLNMPF
jgi:hypothetical protein